VEKPDRVWQLQVAKARFSEVFDLALNQGPQRITRHGKRSAYLVADTDYARLVSQAESTGQTLLSFLMDSPLWASEIDIERIEGVSRNVDFE